MPKDTPGLKFPLQITDENAGYELAELKETVRFNLKNIILTNPNERIMIPDFGVGITQALFERNSYDLLELIRDRLVQQISIYAPYITILELLIDPVSEISIRISLKYEIDFAKIVDILDITVSNN
tara:strand:- start:4255 stop:4632 length:378 start_codon:yes stop_codon:yes gene_type:complete